MIQYLPPRRGTCWLVLASCAAVGMPARPAAAQVPPPSREELMRKWDLDRDGKIDAGEADMARSRMRRERNEALMNSGTDPVTGRPRQASAAAADGRGGPPAPVDDGGLILVPGTGEATPGVSGSTPDPRGAARPAPPERPALPGTRVPTQASTVPSVAPRIPATGQPPGPQAAGSGREAGGGELSSRARILPGTPPTPASPQNQGPRDPRSRISGQERPSPVGERPGIISGGVRAGGAAARPGYGAGPAADLNAGRLPGGLPQTRGAVPGAGFGPRANAMPADAGRPAGPGQVPSRPGMGRYASPVAPAMPSTGVPAAPRPMLRQPPSVRPSSPPTGTAPRVPRVSLDEFYGR